MRIFYRQFKNMDVPQLCKVWNQSGYAGTWGRTFDFLSFDLFVTDNFYFDRRDLIVAVDADGDRGKMFGSDGEIIGFIHGGYGPNADRITPNREEGRIAMMAVKEGPWEDEVRERLLLEMEKHFAKMGIQRVYFGTVYPYAPFYAGLLYGCELNGIPENDPKLSTFLPQKGYISVERFHRMRPPVGTEAPRISFKQQMLAKTVTFMKLERGKTFPNWRRTPDWWEIYSLKNMELSYYALVHRTTKELVARVGLRTLARDAGETLHGLHHLFVTEEYRRKGYARLLLTCLQREVWTLNGKSQVELLVPEKNVNMIELFEHMHFSTVSTGNVYRRDLPDDFLEKVPD
ncbi:MAG: GNAT family N-acetyltransferase [Planctomycetia bacterium]|nr:GNAT family N-acetyltransferase [Planctomycetia bacterium]